MKLFGAQNIFHILRSSDLFKKSFQGVKNRGLDPGSSVQRVWRGEVALAAGEALCFEENANMKDCTTLPG